MRRRRLLYTAVVTEVLGIVIVSAGVALEIVYCADALPPLEEMTRTEEFLYDPTHPTEDFNHKFPEAVRRGRNLEFCPFVQPARVFRVFDRYLALLSASKITPERMCRDWTDEVNRDIKRNLMRYESMRAEYQRRTGRPFDPDNFPPRD